VRVYELARDLRIANAALVMLLQGMGFGVRNHMSEVGPGMIAAIKLHMDAAARAHPGRPSNPSLFGHRVLKRRPGERASEMSKCYHCWHRLPREEMHVIGTVAHEGRASANDTWHFYCGKCCGAAVSAIQGFLTAAAAPGAAPKAADSAPGHRIPRIVVDAEMVRRWYRNRHDKQQAPWAEFELVLELDTMAGTRFRFVRDWQGNAAIRSDSPDPAGANWICYAALAAIYDHAASRRRYGPTGRIRTVAGTSDAPERENVIRIDASGKVRGNLGPEVRRAPRPHERRGHPHTYWVGRGRTEKRVVWLNETRVKGGERGADYRIKP
jgi:hypothetical protein